MLSFKRSSGSSSIGSITPWGQEGADANIIIVFDVIFFRTCQRLGKAFLNDTIGVCRVTKRIVGRDRKAIWKVKERSAGDVTSPVPISLKKRKMGDVDVASLCARTENITLGLCLSLSLSLPTYGNYYSKELHTFWHISSQKIVNKQNAVYVNNQYYFKHSVVQWHWFSKIKHSIRTFTRRHGFFFQSHRRFQTLVYMSLDVWSRKTDVSSVSPRNRMSNGRRITRIS